MLKKLLGAGRRSEVGEVGEDAGTLAGRYFASGMNCAQAVLKACTGRDDEELMDIAGAFGGGIAGSKCLCGAVTGGVIALALKGSGKKSDALVKEFKERYRVTCCSVLSRPYEWKSRDHLANCRRITEETAQMVERMLKG
jgi:C_GCAxxG_C_C family probable redox protein